MRGTPECRLWFDTIHPNESTIYSNFQQVRERNFFGKCAELVQNLLLTLSPPPSFCLSCSHLLSESESRPVQMLFLKVVSLSTTIVSLSMKLIYSVR